MLTGVAECRGHPAQPKGQGQQGTCCRSSLHCPHGHHPAAASPTPPAGTSLWPKRVAVGVPHWAFVGPVSCGHSFSVTSGWSARLSSKFVLLGSPHFCSAGYTVKKLISLRSYQKLQSARHFLPFGLFSVPIRVSGCWFLQHHFTCLLAFY